MVILKSVLATTSTLDVMFGLPEPVGLMFWGMGLLVLSVRVRHGALKVPEWGGWLSAEGQKSPSR